MSKKTLEDMNTFEQARWYALIEAVNLVGDECEKRGRNFNGLKISPLDIEKYIEGTCDIFARKIEEELSVDKMHTDLRNTLKRELQEV